MSEALAGMMVTPSVRLVRPLGEGGMGAVWVADHLALRTEVVVKFIGAGLKDSKDAIERFSREAAAAAQVKSPHVVQTFDHGITPDGTPYIVMELLEGRDLGRYLDDESRCSAELALEIVAQLGRALDRAHARGIIHRDIKPGNVFLCDGGRGDVFVKLLDFGIAKGVDIPTLDSGTKTGAMIGSPFYMSPEQILGSKSLDHRSDLWSLGVVAYEILTGQKPFDAETMGGLAIRIHSEPLPLPSAALSSLPSSVDAWFAKACSRDVEGRFGSAKEMAEALAAALGGEMPRSVDLPRSSTRPPTSLAGENDPTLAVAATTDAGTARTVPKTTSRNRVLGVTASAIFLGIGAWAVARAARAPRPSDAGSATNVVTASPVVSLSSASPSSSASPDPPPSGAATPTPPSARANASSGDRALGDPVLGALEKTRAAPALGGSRSLPARPKGSAKSLAPTGPSARALPSSSNAPTAPAPVPAPASTVHDIY